MGFWVEYYGHMVSSYMFIISRRIVSLSPSLIRDLDGLQCICYSVINILEHISLNM